MVLAIDIGNSDIVLGGYENDTLRLPAAAAPTGARQRMSTPSYSKES